MGITESLVRRIAAIRDKRKRHVPEVVDLPTSYVVVVGNSSDMLESRLGELIDGAEIVLRLNDFVVTGHEADVGSKTSLLIQSPVITGSVDANRVPWSQRFVFRACFDSQNRDAEARMLSERGLFHPGNPLGMSRKSAPGRLPFLPQAIYRWQLAQHIGLSSESQWPSTGAVAVQFALEQFAPMKPIAVCGFGSAARSTGSIDHYYGKLSKRDGSHDFVREQAWLHELSRRGDIVFLGKGSVRRR